MLKVNKSHMINPSMFPNHPVASLSHVDKIIVHYTAAPKQHAPVTCDYFRKLASSTSERIASAHFVVDLDGTVYQFIPLSKVAWHAGNDGVNRSSVGIEMCIVDPNTFTKETIEATQRLVASLMKKYNITNINNVKRHYDITGKICPKPFVDSSKAWKEFKGDIERIMSGSDVNNDSDSFDTEATSRSRKKESIENLFESVFEASY